MGRTWLVHCCPFHRGWDRTWRRSRRHAEKDPARPATLGGAVAAAAGGRPGEGSSARDLAVRTPRPRSEASQRAAKKRAGTYAEAANGRAERLEWPFPELSGHSWPCPLTIFGPRWALEYGRLEKEHLLER